MDNSTINPSSRSTGQGLLLWISWLWVGIPLLWGIYATVIKSLDLFR
jgi:hypothetical protein